MGNSAAAIKCEGKRPSMKVVDADSQFTADVYLNDPQIAPETSQLIQNGCLCFGHWALGEQHNTFAVLLRKMDAMTSEHVLRHLKEVCDTAFNACSPDLIIFPGDSTAIHLAERFAKDLGADGKTIVASPAFRSYGKYELRLELSHQHKAPLAEKKEINVLFFDDSLSSGQTETHAIEAFLKEQLASFQGKDRRIFWQTYAVVNRGQRLTTTSSVIQRENPAISRRDGFTYSCSCFTSIGPESLNKSICPLCIASERLRNAVNWAEGARPSVRELLGRMHSFLETRSMERLNSPLSFISSNVTGTILRLASMAMPNACIYVRKQLSESTLVDWSSDDRLASLMFLALYYDDVCSYLSMTDLVKFASEVADMLEWDDQVQRDTFLAIVAIFPTSFVQLILPAVAKILMSKAAVDLLAAVLCIVFSWQHHILQEMVTRDSQVYRRRIAFERRRDLILKVKEIADATIVSRSHREGWRPLHQVILTDLSIVGNQPRADSPKWVARTLSALLHRGKHPSFLSDQVENLTISSVPVVRDGLLQALRLMQRLPAAVIENLKPRLNNLTREIQSSHAGDLPQWQKLASSVMEEIWIQSIHRRYFIVPKLLQTALRRLTVAPIEKYPTAGIKSEHIVLLPCDEITMAREAFGPDEMNLASHLSNLLTNPFNHFPLEQFQPESGDPPVIIGYIKIDDNLERLILVVIDRAKSADRTRLFTRTHGLANVRALLQIFGGDIEYQDAKDGLYDTKHAPTPKQMEFLKSRNIDLGIYQNVFVTAFPLMLQTQ